MQQEQWHTFFRFPGLLRPFLLLLFLDQLLSKQCPPVSLCASTTRNNTRDCIEGL